MTDQRLTARAERTILRSVVQGREQAIGAFEALEDLVTELNAFERAVYETDRDRFQALIFGGDAPAA
ncbi:hypothetical protein GR157_33515 [Burkholderia sp. 4701]|nr:hypothetical protein [Burkholderia sp. 4701]MXN86928.1 hypothetical protein [Burkholderia sp. 4812]